MEKNDKNMQGQTFFANEKQFNANLKYYQIKQLINRNCSPLLTEFKVITYSNLSQAFSLFPIK